MSNARLIDVLYILISPVVKIFFLFVLMFLIRFVSHLLNLSDTILYTLQSIVIAIAVYIFFVILKKAKKKN